MAGPLETSSSNVPGVKRAKAHDVFQRAHPRKLHGPAPADLLPFDVQQLVQLAVVLHRENAHPC
jgi:hypothetical protein